MTVGGVGGVGDCSIAATLAGGMGRDDGDGLGEGVEGDWGVMTVGGMRGAGENGGDGDVGGEEGVRGWVMSRLGRLVIG